MSRSGLAEWGRIALVAAVGIGGFAIYVWGAVDSPVLDSARAAEKSYIDRVLKARTIDPSAERALAEAYWNRNPDVAKDAYYGRSGKLGLSGARAHYERYGKAEGRKWGLKP